MVHICLLVLGVFFQAEDGIRDAQESRGLGDVYKRQILGIVGTLIGYLLLPILAQGVILAVIAIGIPRMFLSLIHI